MISSIEHYKNIIEKEIGQLDFPSDPDGLYQSLSYFLNIGGKRIRPALTLIAAEMFGKIDQKIIDVAIGIELFHNFTLLHDDIMDNSDIRRNSPTVHRKWNVNTAILGGDVLFIEAMKKITNGNSDLVNQLFLQTSKEVCEGQQYDMLYEKNGHVSIDDYIEMIRLKTSVLLGCALKSGAILAKADVVSQNFLYEFGINIGIAFQLQDDYLDVYGASQQFGKNIGGDIVNNKRTYLYLKALELAPNDTKELMLLLQNEKNSLKKVRGIKRIYDDLKIPKISKEITNLYFEKGLSCLEKIKVEKQKKQPLIDLVEYLYKREN